ncbi:hypothetical protein GTP55_01230 [Duganella sp. FT109W]|uniref:Uncharacterized protein n=1 Tax=Duganella margarita TaxID=2692170 RepID=A0ABW9WAQ6_9BURK|nr:hypothetical protein [Duganella margarita]MYN37989.1 hypothetical protein [Duganella margarita]
MHQQIDVALRHLLATGRPVTAIGYSSPIVFITAYLAATSFLVLLIVKLGKDAGLIGSAHAFRRNHGVIRASLTAEQGAAIQEEGLYFHWALSERFGDFVHYIRLGSEETSAQSRRWQCLDTVALGRVSSHRLTLKKLPLIT